MDEIDTHTPIVKVTKKRWVGSICAMGVRCTRGNVWTRTITYIAVLYVQYAEQQELKKQQQQQQQEVKEQQVLKQQQQQLVQHLQLELKEQQREQQLEKQHQELKE